MELTTNSDNRAEDPAVCDVQHFSQEPLLEDPDVLLAVLSEGWLSPQP